MSRVNTDKKLELIKAIRMQNHYDRQLFRMREGFLYSDSPQYRHKEYGNGEYRQGEYRHGELYSLEAPEKSVPEERSRTLTGFRIRFVLAVLLLIFFILCDVNHISFGKIDADGFFEKLQSSVRIEEISNFKLLGLSQEQ